MNGIEYIQQEREKQITKHGYTPEHDLMYENNQLMLGALSYLNTAIFGPGPGGEDWPFPMEYFKPGTDIVENLSKAGAFIAAEIDRLKLKEQKDDK